MFEINNLDLYSYVKGFLLSNKKFLCRKIGHSSEDYISSTLKFGNVLYCVVSLNGEKFIALAFEEEFLGAAILNLNQISLKEENEHIICTLRSSLFDIESVSFIDGEGNEFSFKYSDLDKFVLNTGDIAPSLLTSLFKLRIVFQNNEIKFESVCTLYGYIEGNIIFENYIFFTTKVDDYSILIPDVADLLKIDHISRTILNNNSLLKKNYFISTAKNDLDANSYYFINEFHVIIFKSKGLNFLIFYSNIVEKEVFLKFNFERMINRFGILKRKSSIHARILHKITNYDTYENIRNYAKTPQVNKNAALFYKTNFDIIKINSSTVLVECLLGNEFLGNIFYLVKYFINQGYEVIVAANNTELIQKKVSLYNLNCKIVSKKSVAYAKYLLSASILINDTTFPRWFIKKTEQVYINTWHGTPLKTLGKSITADQLILNNSQRNLLIADFVLPGNSFTKNILERDYMLDIQSTENIKVIPAMKFEAFSEERRRNLRDLFNVSNKKIVVWMPTWRGEGNTLGSISENIDLFIRMSEILNNLPSEYIVYVKLHQLLTGKINLEELKLNEVPLEYEIYDFLNIADILLTDYSSILFDFAICNRPIILDIFDLETYSKDRGFSMDISSLPFKKANNSEELIKMILSEDVVDYTDFNKLYNNKRKNFTYESLLKDIKADTVRKKVLLYPGALLTNGMTTSFYNLLSNIENNEKVEFIIFLPNNIVKKINLEKLSPFITNKFKYISSPVEMVLSIKEASIYKKYGRRLPLNDSEKKIIGSIFKRENDRLFGDLKFDYVVHFTGYDFYASCLFANMDTNIVPFIHNNMLEELKMKNSFNSAATYELYDKAEKIAVVNEELKMVLCEEYIHSENIDKLCVVHNTINQSEVIKNSMLHEDYMDLVEGFVQESEFMISIGRFSPEKGHLRLISAFEKFKCTTNSSLKLIIVAGYGIDRSKVFSKVDRSNYSESILILENINPFPILKNAKFLISSSFIEGLPMVFFEAIALDTPIISTNIPGPRAFLEQGYGNICDDSEEGIFKELCKTEEKSYVYKRKPLDKFNSDAISEFIGLFY